MTNPYKGLRFQHHMSLEASKNFESYLEKELKEMFPKISDEQIDKIIDTESIFPGIINAIFKGMPCQY